MRKGDSNARNKGTHHALLAAVSLLGVSLLSVSFDVTAAQAASNMFMNLPQNQTVQQNQTGQPSNTKQINSWSWGASQTTPGAGKSSQTLKEEKFKQEKLKEEKLKDEHEAHHKKGEKGLKGETTNTPTPAVGYDLSNANTM
jgi:hypothetical protein